MLVDRGQLKYTKEVSKVFNSTFFSEDNAELVLDVL